jgi:predicted enzyme related to lactoylglutathione lyase
MPVSRVIHFDLSADQPERAAEFYRDAFNWKVTKWEGPDNYWLIQTGSEEEPGITGGVAGRIKPEDTTAIIFDVESVDEAGKKVVEAGGRIREEKRAIPGVGYLVMCKDTEGNTFGIMELDDSVK